MDRNGRIRKLGLVSKRRDKWRGFLRGLRRLKIDHFSDHSIHGYIDAILKAVHDEDEHVKSGGQAKPASAYADTDE